LMMALTARGLCIMPKAELSLATRAQQLRAPAFGAFA
jgi:hypothetical protein